jgi:hypothetical protein
MGIYIPSVIRSPKPIISMPTPVSARYISIITIYNKVCGRIIRPQQRAKNKHKI